MLLNLRYTILLALATLIFLVVEERESMLVGGQGDVNLTDPSQFEHMKQLALFAVKTISEQRMNSQSSAGNPFNVTLTKKIPQNYPPY